MGEIEIKLRLGDESESTYRFSQFPIEIGRADDCQLSIHHEAIARKLCRVWIDPNDLIHLEEYPALTNPIFENRKKVQNGICKDRLSLTVGPVIIQIRNTAAPLLPNRSVRHRKPLVAAVILLLTAISLIFCQQRYANFSGRQDAMVSAFPSTVPLTFPKTPRESEVPTDVLVQLAQTEFMRLPENIHRKKRAIALIWRAEKHQRAQSQKSERCRTIRMTWTAEINKAYRLEIVNLLNALKNKDNDTIRESAGRLQQFLSGTHKTLVSWLMQLEKNGGPE